ncbi:glycoside hydrolase family 108 protein [Chromobacterium haemolyticum]|uniref:glycoside hydrolase family 108 protein n=1 Tax=Chromobacterium haemolyticum TaxID=394935 RepID=UPI0009D9A34C|nr:glycosyl hydrolase 108 family protein [Chromobacterium haemolyticum]OQS31452.1 hypothetical protein B0T39_24155 [Chromobacterium haemolyticum]
MVDMFEKSFERVIGHEGGYVNNPKDPGGETKWGVTCMLARAKGYSGNMRDMTRDQAREIYKSAFWDGGCYEFLGPVMSFQYFDTAVNHGVLNATKLLQRALGIKDDGVFGDMTKQKVKACLEMDLLLKFNKERIEFYTGLSTFSVFGKGWMRRVAINMAYGVDDNKGGV